MASVWRGTHISTGRRIAIKVLDDRLLANAGVVERFGREARAASSIRHESIVDVLDLDRTEEGAPFLVMEFLEGETLTQRIERKGRLSESEILAIADPLLDALHAAHEAGVVHRDLKPDNIMLVSAGRRGEKVKVLDFGISSKSDEVSSLTVTGGLLGTPHYMSPEQARGRTDIDRRADVYAIGVVLYECAVGEVPFDAENYNALIQEILNAAPVPPRARGAGISEAFEAVLLRALRKDRAQRPSSAEVLRDQLLDVGTPPAPASTSGSIALGSAASGDRMERTQLATLDEPDAELLPPPPPPKPPPKRAPPPPPPPPAQVTAPVQMAAARRSPLEATPSTPPPGPGPSLELDARAVRRVARRPSGSTRAPVDGPDGASGLARWIRLAIATVVVVVVLSAAVRFVVRPLSLPTDSSEPVSAPTQP